MLRQFMTRFDAQTNLDAIELSLNDRLTNTVFGQQFTIDFVALRLPDPPA
jgi:hypothetical protein